MACSQEEQSAGLKHSSNFETGHDSQDESSNEEAVQQHSIHDLQQQEGAGAD